MAVLMLDGFDSYGDTNGVAPVGLEYRYPTVNNAVSMRVQAGRTGSGHALEMLAGSSRHIISPHLGNVATVIVGFGFKFVGSHGNIVIFYLLDGGTAAINIRMTAAGELAIYRLGSILATTSGLNLTSGAWQYIELKVTTHNSTGSYELRVNGTPVLSASGIDTQPGVNAYIT